ncbi:MAG: hypothetical protein KDF64_03835 [Geminicoccaceae bacterium]|nr:hypothetical protein [Geminicoccaceae bacterium]
MARLYFHRTFKRHIDRFPAIDRTLRHAEKAIIGVLWAAARMVTVERASDLGAAFGGWIGPRLRKNKHVLRNLEIVFPERDPDWIAATAMSTWRQIGRTLAEYPHIDELCRLDDKKRVELTFEGPPEEIRDTPLGLVFLAMHQANWNLPAMAGALGGFPLDVIYAEQKDPGLEAMIAGHRNRMPSGFIHVHHVPRKMIDALRKGRGVGLFIDHRNDDGDLIPFFGHDALTTTIPARIACKLGTGVVPTRIERLDGVRFRLTLARPIHADPAIANDRDSARDVTERVHRHFERWVREKPEDWCCIKRRWPKHVNRSTPRRPHMDEPTAGRLAG